MQRNHKDFFPKIPYINPPDHVEFLVLSRIAALKKRASRIRFAFESVTTGGSLVAILYIGTSLWHSLSQTGFYEYLSFLFSDSSILLKYWQEFAFSLAESLPLFSLIALLATMSIFIWSLTQTIREARCALLRTQ